MRVAIFLRAFFKRLGNRIFVRLRELFDRRLEVARRPGDGPRRWRQGRPPDRPRRLPAARFNRLTFGVASFGLGGVEGQLSQGGGPDAGILRAVEFAGSSWPGPPATGAETGLPRRRPARPAPRRTCRRRRRSQEADDLGGPGLKPAAAVRPCALRLTRGIGCLKQFPAWLPRLADVARCRSPRSRAQDADHRRDLDRLELLRVGH